MATARSAHATTTLRCASTTTLRCASTLPSSWSQRCETTTCDPTTSCGSSGSTKTHSTCTSPTATCCARSCSATATGAATATGGGAIMALDWQAIVRELVHPTVVEILLMCERQTLSPKQMAERLDAPLGQVSYHVRRLAD